MAYLGTTQVGLLIAIFPFQQTSTHVTASNRDRQALPRRKLDCLLILKYQVDLLGVIDQAGRLLSRDMMKQKRELFRVALDREGELRRGDEIASCRVVDVTEKGVRLTTDLQTAKGDTLELSFRLADSVTIHCHIEATFATPPHVGGRISAISPDHQMALVRFLDQINALNVTGF